MDNRLTFPSVQYIKALLSAVYREVSFTWDEGSLSLTARTGEAAASLTEQEIAFRATRPAEAAELLSRRLDAAIVASFKKGAER